MEEGAWSLVLGLWLLIIPHHQRCETRFLIDCMSLVMGFAVLVCESIVMGLYAIASMMRSMTVSTPASLLLGARNLPWACMCSAALAIT